MLSPQLTSQMPITLQQELADTLTNLKRSRSASLSLPSKPVYKKAWHGNPPISPLPHSFLHSSPECSPLPKRLLPTLGRPGLQSSSVQNDQQSQALRPTPGNTRTIPKSAPPLGTSKKSETSSSSPLAQYPITPRKRPHTPSPPPRPRRRRPTKEFKAACMFLRDFEAYSDELLAEFAELPLTHSMWEELMELKLEIRAFLRCGSDSFFLKSPGNNIMSHADLEAVERAVGGLKARLEDVGERARLELAAAGGRVGELDS